MNVRPAVPEDEELILTWANDPLTRATGFQVEPIEPDAHHRWFIGHLDDPRSSRIWIGVDAGPPVGVVRVEKVADGMLIVSITLDPAQRGQAKSHLLLQAGLAAARSAYPGAGFRAWIRPDNRPSLALFRSAGFQAPTSRPAIVPPGAGPDAVVLERD